VRTTADWMALDETSVFLGHFKDPKDPLQQGKVDYRLKKILLLCLPGVPTGAEIITGITLFGRKEARPAAPLPPVRQW